MPHSIFIQCTARLLPLRLLPLRLRRPLLLLITLVTLAPGPAFATGSDEWSSPILMRTLARANLAADLIAGRGDAYQPGDDELDAAISRLDLGLAAADRVLTECSEVLFPSAERERSIDQRRAYGAAYRAHMALFRAAMVEYQSRLASLRDQPLHERDVGALKQQRLHILNLTNVAHDDLRRPR